MHLMAAITHFQLVYDFNCGFKTKFSLKRINLYSFTDQTFFTHFFLRSIFLSWKKPQFSHQVWFILPKRTFEERRSSVRQVYCGWFHWFKTCFGWMRWMTAYFVHSFWPLTLMNLPQQFGGMKYDEICLFLFLKKHMIAFCGYSKKRQSIKIHLKKNI